MRWIVTVDHHGGCLGMGEDADGVPARGKPEQGDALPMEFRLYEANGNLLFEGRCGDIDADWWHGFEPLNYLWQPFRCRRLHYRRAGTKEPWRALRPYRHAKTIPAAGFAWEYLRRDEDYHHDFRAISRLKNPTGSRLDAFARRWGLRFPLRP